MNDPDKVPAQKEPESDDKEPKSYEEAYKELKGLVEQLENNNPSLEESLKSYQRGALLVSYCNKKLKAAEDQIRILDGDLLKPFDQDKTPE